MVIRMKHEELEQILNDIDLTKEAPAQEPQRQYYYMKRARQIVAQQEEVLGTQTDSVRGDIWLSDEC